LTDITQARAEALRLAVRLHSGAHPPWGVRLAEQVLADAGLFELWLLGRPARLKLAPGPFTYAQGAPGPGTPTIIITSGDQMAVQMLDTQTVGYTCEPEDSKGYPVADTLTWTESSAGAVVTATPAADGLSCVFAAVAPGTATITVTDGTLSGSDVITVTAGPVAALVLTPGTPA
jgi:hypothetical protein